MQGNIWYSKFGYFLMMIQSSYNGLIHWSHQECSFACLQQSYDVTSVRYLWKKKVLSFWVTQKSRISTWISNMVTTNKAFFCDKSFFSSLFCDHILKPLLRFIHRFLMSEFTQSSTNDFCINTWCEADASKQYTHSRQLIYHQQTTSIKQTSSHIFTITRWEQLEKN